jgi:hypothetical protein
MNAVVVACLRYSDLLIAGVPKEDNELLRKGCFLAGIRMRHLLTVSLELTATPDCAVLYGDVVCLSLPQTHVLWAA